MNKTPKLRFKEFSGEWEFNRLSKVCEINPKSREIPDEFFYIDLESVVKGELIKENIVIKEEAPSRAQRSLSPKDVLFQTVRPYQNNNYYFKRDRELPTVASTGYAQLRSHRNSEFLYYLIHTHRFGKNVLLRCTGSNYPAINTTDLSEIEIHYPSIKEQEKIASLFSLIDDKISLQSEKVEKLKDYKKGMMQKIFSRELRFKDDEGRDYPEWEEKKLGDITEIGTGSNDLQDKVEDGKYPFFVRSANIERINSYTFDGEAILIPGDGNIGQIYHYINGKFAYHQRVYKISGFIDGVSGKYIYYYMSRFFLKEALKNSVKATVDSLRLPTLTGMDILLPCIEEQEKITKLLSELEVKVEKEQEKLDSLNKYKRGLLQQMFI